MGETPQRVVVLGAGFAGLAVSESLSSGAGSLDLETIVVDRHGYNTFQPLLYQVATAGLSPGDIAYPVRSYLRGRTKARFRKGEVGGIDFEHRQVSFSGDEPALSYDYLVIASGGRTNFFGVPGAEENSHAIYTMEDAIAVRDDLEGSLEHAASFGPKEGDLTVVLVGGGPTGVEMAGTLAELRNAEIATSYPRLDSSAARIVLVEQLDRLLASFDERLGRYAEKALVDRGVEVMLGRQVLEIAPRRVLLDGGEEISCAVVVWAAGVRPSELSESLETTKEKGGRLAVDGFLRLEGHPEVFCCGDAAGARSAGSRELLPQLAQPAIQEGRHVGRQVLASIRGEELEEFSYKDKGVMATIGRRAAVAELRGGIRLKGTLAWLAWLFLHITFLIGTRNKVVVLCNWAWRYIWWRRGARVVAGT